MNKPIRLLGLAAIAAMASTQAVTLTFDELPSQPVDGLSFQGVTFGYTIGGSPSTDAYYNTSGPGNLTYVQDGVLEGSTAGTLTLNFANPTPFLQFGVALSTSSPLRPGAVVSLYNSSSLLIASLPVNTDPLIMFTEAQFTYSGTPISKAVIELDMSASRFAVDNVSFAVPEPGTYAGITALGLLGVAAWRGRRA